MAEGLRVTQPEKKALAVATVIALLFGAYFLRHYVTLIIFAGILAYLFNPVYQKRIEKGKSPGSASAQTFLIASVAILIPLIGLFVLTGFQITHTVQTVSESVDTVEVTDAAQRLIDQANNLLSRTPITFQITPEWLQQTGAAAVQKVGTALLDSIKGYLGGFFGFFTTAIIFIFVFLSLLKNQIKILETVRLLNPLGNRMHELYITRIGAMTKAMVRGQFIIAIMQGTVDAVLIYLGGLHEAFFFLLIILIALSFVPLGGGILAIPLGIIMALTGNVWGGLLVVAGHLIIVTNIDNIFRPRLVPSQARLDSALMILSVFSGIALLGFLGIVVGPVIMIVIVTTIDMYLQVYRDVKVIKEKPAKSERGFGHRFVRMLKSIH